MNIAFIQVIVREHDYRVLISPCKRYWQVGMLQNLSSEVTECLRHADDCAQRAKREPDPLLRRDFFDMELRWLKLARSYQFADELRAFTSYNAQQRGELTERLERLKRRMDQMDANRPIKS